MANEEKGEEKKLFIDEDWKGRVAAEKEAARQQQEGQPAAQRPAEATAQERPTGPLPPPSLTLLVTSLYLQGMVSLGLLPGPESDKPEVDFPQAKHTIDTLQMLQEKTEGNRTPEESAELEAMLHELRLAFVQLQPTPT